jgi:hypothetical protein
MEDFNQNTSFDELLKNGEIHDALEMRLEDLEMKAGGNCAEIEAAKISSAALVITGFVLATPVTAVFAGMGAIAYLYSVASDFHQTHKFALFPLVRTGFGDLLSGVGLAATGHSKTEDADDIARAESYLSPREAKEYRLLATNPDRVSKWLLEQPAEQRSLAYKSLTRNLGAKQAIAQPANQPTASPEIGADTRLGAVEVPAIAPAQSEVAASPAGQTEVLFNPAIDLGQNPQSALIVGTPGSGKGILVSNAVRVLREKAPALKVMMIDPKSDKKESGYWDGVDVYRPLNLMECDDPDEGASWLLACMDEFRKLDAPKLLIFDEMLAASTEISLAHKDFKAPQRLKKFISGIIAQGDSQGVWVWAMSQSVQVADLGFGGGVRGNLRAIAIISPKNTTAIEALTSTRLIPPPNGGMDELREIMKASPVDRAFYDGKVSRWLPMPELENHSGFDRDNRAIEANPTVSKSDAPKTQEKPAESPTQNKPASPVDQLNKMFGADAYVPPHEDNDAENETAIEKVGTVIEISSDLGSYIKSRPDVTLWNVSSIKRANKKFRRHDDANLTKAFQILALSDRGEWDGESFRPS